MIWIQELFPYVYMTQIDELLIARTCPIMTVYHKHGGQLGYSGHVLNLPQNIQQFINKLPVKVTDLPILTITKQGATNTYHNFHVRRDKVLYALQWLKHNNKFYTDIEIDLDSIQQLPVDGIPEELHNFELSDVDDEPIANEGPPTEQLDDSTCSNPSSSFIPCVQQTQTEEAAIRSTIAGTDPLQWPHPRFPYWALNMKQRHELLSQSKVYIQQHPCDASLTVQDMVGAMDSVQLMNRLQRYATKLLGSKQYWYTRYQELKALLEQKGAATFFTSADNYWPELHSLQPHHTQRLHMA